MKNIHKVYRKWLFPKIRNTRGAVRFLNFIEDRLASSLPQVSEEEAESIFCEDWDNLIILDGCRHDIYQEFSRSADFRISLGSNSSEYIKRTFSDRDAKNIVYITANPFFDEAEFESLTGKKPEETFHTVYKTYETDWDFKEGTVLAKNVSRDALNAEKLFPDKKKIIHFMQPHYPFIGSHITKAGIRPDLDHEKEGSSAWEEAMKGNYEKEDLLNAYRLNLEYVLKEVEKLRADLSGKTIITADHGNFIGENNLYGHPPNNNAEAVRKVPWDVF